MTYVLCYTKTGSWLVERFRCDFPYPAETVYFLNGIFTSRICITFINFIRSLLWHGGGMQLRLQLTCFPKHGPGSQFHSGSTDFIKFHAPSFLINPRIELRFAYMLHWKLFRRVHSLKVFPACRKRLQKGGDIFRPAIYSSHKCVFMHMYLWIEGDYHVSEVDWSFFFDSLLSSTL